MKLDKKDILKALETITIAGEGKNMVESGAVKNVVTFGDEVIIDLVLSTPAMHIKKRAEDDIKKTIYELVSADAKIQIKSTVVVPEPNEIKGKAVPGMKNIIAIASGIATITSVDINDFSGNGNSVLINYTGISDYEFSLDGVHFQNSPLFTNVQEGDYLVYIKDIYGCGMPTPTKIFVFIFKCL